MPFTQAEFLDVFRRYNEAVWPAQLALVMLGLAALVFAAVATPRASAAAGIALAALWFWSALAYHLAFFSEINPAAAIFAVAFIIQAILIVVHTAGPRRIELRFRRDAVTALGALIAGYGLVGYPLLGHLLGHRYPTAPTFGVPCPTTIFTLGLFLLVKPPFPRVLLIVPGLWAAIGSVAAISLGMPEDLGLPIAALLVIAITAVRGHGSRRDTAAAPPLLRRGGSPAMP